MDVGRGSHAVRSSADPASFLLRQEEGTIEAGFKQRPTKQAPERFKYVIDVRY